MKYAYYPGCASESTAQELHESMTAIAKALGINLIELSGWTCCGSTPAHQTNKLIATTLPANNLYLAKKMGSKKKGLDIIVNCAACYNRLKKANYDIKNNPDIRNEVCESLGNNYDGSTNVYHFTEVILKDIGLKNLSKQIKYSLGGFKVASYYGCLLVRPKEITKYDDTENPMILDNIIDALGGKSIDWPHKVECCGGCLSITKTEVAAKLSESILEMAHSCGCHCIAVACPMCQLNLDIRQKDIKDDTNIPIIYITQLIGLCLGIKPKALGLDKLIVSPSRIGKFLHYAQKK